MTDTVWYSDERELWACGRAMGGYIGSFPNGFLPRLQNKLGLDIYNKTVFFPFGGATPDRDNWVTNDIKKDKPTGPNDEPLPADYGYDARELPSEWTNKFPIIVSDPPYGKVYSEELYDLDYPHPKSHMSESTRVLEPGGYLVILDQLVYNLEWAHDGHRVARESVHAITTGPGMRARAVNVFRKPNRLHDWE